jgi:hypothetical protein
MPHEYVFHTFYKKFSFVDAKSFMYGQYLTFFCKTLFNITPTS